MAVVPLTVEHPEYFELFSPAYSADSGLTFSGPWQALSLRGIGMPPLNRRTTRSPEQDGVTVVGEERARSRMLTLTAMLRRPWGPAVPRANWGSRKALIALLSPAVSPLTFRVWMSNGDSYDLTNVYHDAGLDSGYTVRERFGHQRISFRLRAMDPIWRGPDLTSSTTSGVTGAWNPTIACANLGDYFVYPTITLTGPMTLPLLEIQEIPTTKIELAESILAGNTVVITLAFGSRSVRTGVGVLVDITEDTTLSTFRFDPFPVRDPGGTSTIELTTTGATIGGSQISVAWNYRWIGI